MWRPSLADIAAGFPASPHTGTGESRVEPLAGFAPASPAFTRPDTFTTRPTLQGTFGMSASTHWLATAAAQAVLERGGNAFDAATAGAFVLHVVEPHLNGPGGDMTGVFVTAEEPGRPVVLMGQGPAPAGATVEHYLAEGLDLVPGSGALAAAVPAAVDAWLLLLRDHGTWELGDVLDFAIGYARDGHPMLGRVGTTIAAVAELFQTHWPTSAELWMPGGRIPAEGELVRNPAYARTLQRLVDVGTAGPAGHSRESQDRRRPPRVARGLRGQGHGGVGPDPAPAFLRYGSPGCPRTGGSLRIRGRLRGRRHGGIPRTHHRQDGTVGAGSRAAPDARHS